MIPGEPELFVLIFLGTVLLIGLLTVIGVGLFLLQLLF